MFNDPLAPANYTLQPGQAFWLKSMQADNGSGYSVFNGLTQTNAVGQSLYTNAWRMIGYPFARPRVQSDTAGGVGWGFLAQGAHAGTSADSADNMYVLHNGLTYLLWLKNDGFWYIQNTTNRPPANMSLNNVGAAFYFTRGTSFVWRATQP